MALEWKTGDVYALPLITELSKEKGLQGQYLLLQKVDEMNWYPNKTVPILYAKITENKAIPTDEESYNCIPYIQTTFTKWEDRFWPIDGRCPQEDIKEKQHKEYTRDEYGFLPQYRFVFVRPVSRAVPKQAIFVGHYSYAKRPDNEFIPHSSINIIDCPKYEPLETWLIERYFDHNKRGLSIYKRASETDYKMGTIG